MEAPFSRTLRTEVQHILWLSYRGSDVGMCHGVRFEKDEIAHAELLLLSRDNMFATQRNHRVSRKFFRRG